MPVRRARPENRPRSKKAAPEQASILPPAAITEHSIRLAGVEVPYSAKAATLALRDARGKTLADIFYIAYMREPLDPKRPITFVFNGGPGAASAYLHLGAIGPKVMAASAKGEVLGPPPRLVTNDSSWLDFTDLVFVDPVGTGYSRARDGKDENDFFGVEQDTEALANFIRLYLTDAGRLASPVFLAGESYGGFRVATITRALQKTSGISPSGLVLISPALEFALLNGEDYDPLPWALGLPSLAAVNLESKGIAGTRGARGGTRRSRALCADRLSRGACFWRGGGRRDGERYGGAADGTTGRNRAPELRPHSALRSSSRSSIVPTAKS